MTHSTSATAIELLRMTASNHRRCNNSSNMVHWLDAVSRYSGFTKAGLLDIVSDATNISLSTFAAEADEPSPLLRQAIKDTNPDFDFSDPPSGEELQGAINAAKGKYFEYLVADRLNSGERIGALVLPDGFKAILADSAIQPGWDLAIVNPSGHTVEYLQLKASDSLSYVKDALDRYPDIRILAANEIASNIGKSDLIIDADISDKWLSGVVQDAMVDNENFADFFVESFSPLISLAIIAGTEGMQLLVSRKSVSDALSSGLLRSGRSIASQAVAAAIYASGGGWLSVPAGMFTRMVLERMHDLNIASQIIIRSRIEMVQLRLFQQDQLLLR